MQKPATPFRVGLLVLTSGAFLVLFLTFVKKGGLSQREALTVHAYFQDASGLSEKSRVQIAGIPVGEVTDISLERTRAKVTLRVRRDADLRKDATLTKRSESLLGDYLLDLQPGSDRAPPMPDGGEIIYVVDSQGMQRVFNSLEDITQDIKSVTAALSDVLGGSKGAGSMQRVMENLIRLSDGLDEAVRRNGDQLGAILQNFEGVSSDVRHVTESQQHSIESIVQNLDAITRDVREVMGAVRQAVGGEGEASEGVAGLKKSMDRLDRTLENVETLTEKVKNGEGIAGKLLGDERLGQKLGETIEDVSDFANRLTRLQLQVGIRSEYLFSQGQTKNFVALKLIPKPDKYYLLEFVDDPRGTVETTTIENHPPSEGDPATQVQRVTRDRIRLSLQFGKRFYFANLRFGIIESTGGLGLDLFAFSDMLSLHLDAFDFANDALRLPRLRAALRFQPTQHLFASFGVDDVLNNPVREIAATNRLIAGRDIFVGLGVMFTDDDLKSILPFASVPSL